MVTFAELALKRGSLQFSPCNANILLAAFSFYTNMYKYVSSVCGVADGWSWKRGARALLGLTLTLCNSNLVILMQKYVLGVCVVADG